MSVHAAFFRFVVYCWTSWIAHKVRPLHRLGLQRVRYMQTNGMAAGKSSDTAVPG